MLALFLFLIFLSGSLMAFMLLFHSLPEKKLFPFAVLPVPDDSPESEAFLKFYASQIIWTDSDIFCTVLLIYPENAPAVRQLCEAFSREHDCFQAVTLSQAQQMIQSQFKNSEIF